MFAVGGVGDDDGGFGDAVEGDATGGLEAMGFDPNGDLIGRVPGGERESADGVCGEDFAKEDERLARGKGDFLGTAGVCGAFDGFGPAEFGDSAENAVDEARAAVLPAAACPLDGVIDCGVRRDAVEEDHLCGGPDERGDDLRIETLPGIAETTSEEGVEGDPTRDRGLVDGVGERAVERRKAGVVEPAVVKVGECGGVLGQAGEDTVAGVVAGELGQFGAVGVFAAWPGPVVLRAAFRAIRGPGVLSGRRHHRLYGDRRRAM